MANVIILKLIFHTKNQHTTTHFIIIKVNIAVPDVILTEEIAKRVFVILLNVRLAINIYIMECVKMTEVINC